MASICVTLLIGRAKAGSESAFGLLHDWFRPHLHRLAGRRPVPGQEADDITQSVALQLHQRLTAGALSGLATRDELLRFLAHQVRQRAARGVRHATRLRRDPAREVPLDAPVIDGRAADPLDDAVRAEFRERAEAVVLTLAEERRAAVRLRLAGHEFVDIGERVGRSGRSAERYWAEFCERFREIVSAGDGERPVNG